MIQPISRTIPSSQLQSASTDLNNSTARMYPNFMGMSLIVIKPRVQVLQRYLGKIALSSPGDQKLWLKRAVSEHPSISQARFASGLGLITANARGNSRYLASTHKTKSDDEAEDVDFRMSRARKSWPPSISIENSSDEEVHVASELAQARHRQQKVNPIKNAPSGKPYKYYCREFHGPHLGGQAP